jgi:hypothetical protein
LKQWGQSRRAALKIQNVSVRHAYTNRNLDSFWAA